MELRINKFVPYSAFSEVFAFGSFYLILYLTIFFYFLKLASEYCIKKRDEIGSMIISGASLLLLFALQSQYSMRTIFKLFFFLILLFTIIKYRVQRQNIQTKLKDA